MKEKRVTAGAFKLSRYSALTDRDSIQVGSSVKELPFEVASEDSDEDGEEDQPGKKIYMNMIVEEDYKDDAPIFAYNGLQVPINILFDQIEGFTLHPRENFNLLPVTSTKDTPPGIRALRNTSP